MQEMEAHYVKLYCVHEDLADTVTGRFISLALGIITEVEREKAADPLLAEPNANSRDLFGNK